MYTFYGSPNEKKTAITSERLGYLLLTDDILTGFFMFLLFSLSLPLSFVILSRRGKKTENLVTRNSKNSECTEC